MDIQFVRIEVNSIAGFLTVNNSSLAIEVQVCVPSFSGEVEVYICFLDIVYYGVWYCQICSYKILAQAKVAWHPLHGSLISGVCLSLIAYRLASATLRCLTGIFIFSVEQIEQTEHTHSSQ